MGLYWATNQHKKATCKFGGDRAKTLFPFFIITSLAIYALFITFDYN